VPQNYGLLLKGALIQKMLKKTAPKQRFLSFEGGDAVSLVCETLKIGGQ